MKPLVIFEMANNHMGDIAHGIAIIKAFAGTVAPYRNAFQFAFKLQYRDLDTFIRPDYRGRSDIKYVKRFEETRLTDADFRHLIEAMREHDFLTVCTPFDEVSVARIEAHGVDMIKIASCALTDWPLLERIALTRLPIIASTAAADVEDIDAVVSFFQHRQKELTLMHCVGEYPTPDERLAISQIELLRQRYRGVRIGFSTHERPDHTESIMLALASGAAAFEKHVGLPTELYALNAYSASPEQIGGWLEAGRRALNMLGTRSRYIPTAAEEEGLRALQRGVFARHDLPVGKVLGPDDVFFAFPPEPGQITANDWSKYVHYTVTEAVAANAPVPARQTTIRHDRQHIREAVKAVRTMLRIANVILPGLSELEISHHYGIDRFAQFGLTMITIVNREYCKKVLVMLAGQTHPEQYHRQKEETFIVLHGTMTLKLDGVAQTVKPGDVVTVERGVRHEFHTETGVVFEEISSTHIQNDSFYTDPAIAANTQRKTLLASWM
ncbi:MAG: N-acetylneuraminate synthase family protein [Sulfuritalea sp.]|jgi:N-acetylneuraminate synthase|nr:N-acetylneuraminate synthase family protein [Sulfuritalea sp.]